MHERRFRDGQTGAEYRALDNVSVWTRATTDAAAFARCQYCTHLGRRKESGNCVHHRVDGKYAPIWAVPTCPVGAELEEI